MYRLALLYDRNKQSENAISALKNAIKLSPEGIHYHQYLGFLYESQNKHKLAVPHFKKVMELEHMGNNG